MDVINLIKERAKKPYPLAKVERRIYAANILLIVSGVSLSISFNDGQYFERFGSLIVIVGILVAWKDLTGRFDRIEDLVSTRIKAELSSLAAGTPAGLLSQAKNIAREGQISEQSEQLNKLFEILRNRIRVIEAITLILGTFIWGFGECLFDLVFKTNA